MNEIDKLLDELLRLADENDTVDFKREVRLSSDLEKEEFAKDVSAFANADGGYILFGREDKKEGGRAVGIKPETLDPDQMQQIVASRCYPPVKFSVQLARKGKKQFAIVVVPSSTLKPHEITRTREVWVRRGGITDRATQTERDAMSRDRVASKALTSDSAGKQIRKGIPEEPESGRTRLVVMVGRWYMQRTYGRLDVSLQREKVAIVVLSIGAFSPLLYLFWQLFSTKSLLPSWFLIFSIVMAIVGFTLLDSLPEVEDLKCPVCNRYFSYRRTRHIRLSSRKLYKTEEHLKREVVYEDTYKCDFCGHQHTGPTRTTETIPIR